MAIFDNFGKKVSKVATDAATKSRELADTARFSVGISDERASIRMIYRDIGEKYYRDLRALNLEDLRSYCEKIDVAAGKISDLEGRIRRIKGIRLCAACGDESDRKARFCAACGQAFPVEEATAPNVAEDAAKPQDP
jgi:hypothetical protein